MMIFVLIAYFVFLFLYLAFNVYGILRIYAMRIQGDQTMRIIVTYLLAVSIILFLSLAGIAALNWSSDLGSWQFLGGQK